MLEERKNEDDSHASCGRRVFGVVVRGYPTDFQAWFDSTRTYDIYVIFSKSTRTSKLVIKEESW